MITGLIISITLAVTFLCLYVAAVQDTASVRKDNEWLRKQRNEKSAEAAPQSAATSQKLPLTINNVGEAIRYNGYIPEQIKNAFGFKVQGEQYAVIFIEDASVAELYKGYRCEYKDYDIDLFKKAAQIVEDKYLFGKIRVQPEEDNDAEFGIEFEISSFELYYEHFRDALPHYIQAMNQIISSFKEEYDKLVEAKQNGNDVTGEDGTYTLPGYARGWDA